MQVTPKPSAGGLDQVAPRIVVGRKAFLAVLLLTAAVGVTTAAGADDPHKPVKAARDTPSIMRDIREGKATKLARSGPPRRTTAVWTGCHFVYLTTEVSDHKFDDGSVAQVSSDPDPLPPRDCVGPDRNPTEAEMNASRADVAARNAGDRGPGVENRPLPPEPRASHLERP